MSYADKIKEDRQFVSRLIYSVLSDRMCVREAILKIPNKSKDKSIETVRHALIHREADEDFRYRDIDYRDEQDSYLEFLAETLQKGEPVPKNIIKEYDDFYNKNKEVLDIHYSDKMKNAINKICKFLNV